MESFYFNYLKRNTPKTIFVLLVVLFCFISNTTLAQVIPTAGETECFVAGNGGVFVDNGGTVANPTVGSDPPGEYLNCACETLTTLCSPDGSAITVDFTEFSVFATFDNISIYDGDTPLGTLLYANGAGAINAGDQDLAAMIASNGGTTFTSMTGCLTFAFFATGVVSDPGWSANVTVASGATHPGDNLDCGTNLSCLAPPNITVDNITNSDADINWGVIDSADAYIIEYGIAGFALGTGTTMTTTNTTLPLTGLMQNTTYEFYIQSDCGNGEFSNNAGPFTFTTLLSCPAPINIMITDIGSSFAEISWDASFAAVSYNVEYGLAGFLPGTGTVVNTTNLSTIITGLTQNTAYDFYVNSDCGNELSNNAILSTFTTLLSCPAPINIMTTDVGPTFIDISWDASFAAVSYNIEYGLAGFLLGTGTVINTTNLSATITGLTQNTAYHFYVHSDCGNELSNNAVVNAVSTTFNNPCDYTLELFDSFGDGWNGSILSVTVGSITTDYTFTTGNTATFTVNAGSNLPLTFTYTAGAFQNEVSYNILDPLGNIIFSDGPNPTVGIVLETFACPTCPGATNLIADNIFGLSADVSWDDSDSSGVYQVEYGSTGFLPGTGTILSSNDPFASLTGLDENTDYDFYVIYFCDNGDTSALAGPSTFTTIALNDVGIISINSPISGCGLTSAETISVTMENFGANPQSLVPFRYSVNGVEAPVTIPLDGFFTNVIGNDSLVTLEFETTFDFSQPGEYIIAAWTEMDPDSDISNDTAIFTVNNIPIIADFPYAQNFEDDNGGWTVSDDSQNSSWAFGQPIGTEIPNAASGINAWVTNLSGNYNNSELSYIVSNCFDFSTLTSDPTISFSINFDTETNFDGGWLESSIDGGITWSKVGSIGTGVNWYNITNTTSAQLGEVWAGNSGGWIVAKNVLTGTAGESNILLRFGFGSDASVNGFEGIGIDNISIFTPVANDLSGQNVMNGNTLECGDPNDLVTISILNNGTATQSNFDVGYKINNGLEVIETTALTLAPDEVGTYTFTTPFNSTLPGTYTITSWSNLNGELNISNDTTVFEFATFQVLPFREDFEVATLPNDWTSDEFNPVSNLHGNMSYVAFDNLFSFDTSFELTSPPIGPISAGDSLYFDYRYVDFTGGGNVATTIGVGDMLELQVSLDCGVTYNTINTIDQSNHVTSNNLATVTVDISSFIGESVKFRFLATWGTGDYYIDIDNINIFQCTSLDLTTDSTMESIPDAGDGVATVTPTTSLGPYTYSWNDPNNSTTATVNGLSAGTYTVVVTDAFGCEDMIDVIVGLGVNTIEVDEIQNVNLYPNPTADMATLDMTFSKSVDVHIHIINTVGQILFETSAVNTTEEKIELDLNDYPSGMYFIRIQADNQTVIKKLMKNQD